MIKVYDKYDGGIIGEAEEEPDTKKIIETVQKAAINLADIDHDNLSEMFLNLSVILSRRSEELSMLITKETGKPLRFTKSDIEKCSGILKFWAHEIREYNPLPSFLPDRFEGVHRTRMRIWMPSPPIFSIAEGFSAFLETVIVFSEFISRRGASVAIVPESNPLQFQELQKMIVESGFPEGSFQASTNSSLLDNHMDDFSFLRMSSYHTESPALVFDDADIDFASESLFKSMLPTGLYGGTRFNRILTSPDSHDYLRNRIMEQCESIVLGDPHDPKTDMSDHPLADQKEMLQEEVGRTLISGGKVAFGDQATFRGITGLDFQGNISQSFFDISVTAPAFYFTNFSSFDEVLGLFPPNRTGQNISIYTKDIDMAMLSAEKLNFRNIEINDSFDPIIGFSRYTGPVLREIFNSAGGEPWPLERWKNIVFRR